MRNIIYLDSRGEVVQDPALATEAVETETDENGVVVFEARYIKAVER